MTPSKSRPNGSGSAFFFRPAFFGCSAPAGLPGRGPPARAAAPGPNSTRSRCFFGSLPNGTRRIDAVVRRDRLNRLAHHALVALAPRRDRAVERATCSRRARRAADRSPRWRPAPDTPGHAPCGELNENARGDISGTLRPQTTQASLRENSRSPPSSELIDDDVAGESERDFDRLGQPALDAAPHDQPIDDDLDRVVAAAIEADVFFERAHLPVDARLGEAARRAAPAAPS